MIQETITFHCESCGSIDITKNGTNKCGSQQYHCKDCGIFRVLKKKVHHAAQKKEQVIKAYKERTSLRGVARIFDVDRRTVWHWVEKHIFKLPPLTQTLQTAQAQDVLEIDEMWSYVGRKKEKQWLWTALCRRTRQVVAFVIGDRSETTCRCLWHEIPKAYRGCQSFSDFWHTYAAVFSSDLHELVGKESGQTAHMERWYNTLRQRIGRYTRKTLSFSKSKRNHWLVTYWFIVDHNLAQFKSPLTM